MTQYLPTLADTEGELPQEPKEKVPDPGMHIKRLTLQKKPARQTTVPSKLKGSEVKTTFFLTDGEIWD